MNAKMYKVLNVMLSRDYGGIQQSFLDYDAAMQLEGVHVVNVVSLGAKIIKNLTHASYQLLNLGPFDILSTLQMRYILSKEKPDMIIAHGNRAIKFCHGTKHKLIGIAHNYSIKYLKKCDYIFALTKHLENYLINRGFEQKRIFLLPNMVRMGDTHRNCYVHDNAIPVIGAMGRFVKKKGFDLFLTALALLHSKNIPFKAVIGGLGDEELHLKQLCTKLNLNTKVTFIGWVSDKEVFFDQIDIFVLPSNHEPFGITLLEAMMRYKPVVSTKSEGPSEIIEDGVSGMLCEVCSVDDMTTKLIRIIEDYGYAKYLAKNAYLRAYQKYDMKVVAKTLYNHLKQIKHDI